MPSSRWPIPSFASSCCVRTGEGTRLLFIRRETANQRRFVVAAPQSSMPLSRRCRSSGNSSLCATALSLSLSLLFQSSSPHTPVPTTRPPPISCVAWLLSSQPGLSVRLAFGSAASGIVGVVLQRLWPALLLSLSLANAQIQTDRAAAARVTGWFGPGPVSCALLPTSPKMIATEPTAAAAASQTE